MTMTSTRTPRTLHAVARTTAKVLMWYVDPDEFMPWSPSISGSVKDKNHWLLLRPKTRHFIVPMPISAACDNGLSQHAESVVTHTLYVQALVERLAKLQMTEFHIYQPLELYMWSFWFITHTTSRQTASPLSVTTCEVVGAGVDQHVALNTRVERNLPIHEGGRELTQIYMAVWHLWRRPTQILTGAVGFHLESINSDPATILTTHKLQLLDDCVAHLTKKEEKTFPQIQRRVIQFFIIIILVFLLLILLLLFMKGKGKKKKQKKSKEERSALSGRKIHRKLKKTKMDKEGDKNREEVLKFLNATM
ncbi:hypothetical protein MAR_001845 [Mya arenaria]|uniref:Uncharacterized protein n=1 Tax=Mya arenaria TaxID=6604 RepID=A0ABY7FG62_MYAAR|nr:hypothetical protein MAR_001845 [Mya arenaria]